MKMWVLQYHVLSCKFVQIVEESCVKLVCVLEESLAVQGLHRNKDLDLEWSAASL